jgi:signal transduction histidine kinase/CheY-like chemotaxis protein
VTPVNPFSRVPFSFKAKVFALTLSLVIGLSLLFPAIFIPYEIRESTGALIKEGTLLCRLLAYSSRIAVFSESPSLLDSAADGILDHKNVRAVLVYAADGRKLFEEQADENHAQDHHALLVTTPEERREMALLARSLVGVTHRKIPQGMEFLAPVKMVSGKDADDSVYWGSDGHDPDRSIGLVRVKLYDGEIRDSIGLLVAFSSVFTLFSILVGSAVAYLIARSVTSPLKRLSTAVAALGAEGKLMSVPVETRDEVGQVAEAFNGLITSLRRREVEKELLEEQLRHSQKQEALGTLAGGVAHDFNTILTAIIGFTELLMKDAAEESTVRHFGGLIRKSADKAAQLIARLLAFSRKQVVNPRPADLNDVIRGMEDILRRVVTDIVTLELVLDPEPIPVLVDANQFDRVLLNLASNARDVMPDGGKLTITTRRNSSCQVTCGGNEQHPGWCAMVTVTDTGEGLADIIREKIFDPFFTTKEVGKGTGMGLSMAYGIIRQHSGTIQAKGVEGVGTTFTICLPGLSPSAREGDFEGLQGVRMVVADADPLLRHQAAEFLRERGIAVCQAEESQDAIRLCSDPEEPVDVLLINILMSGAKGAYEEIRRSRPEVRFIFIGGMRRDGGAEEDALDAGIVTIHRPLDEHELLTKLMKVLGRA